MRRRLTVAILGMAAGALVVAGLGTLLLARLDARDRTRQALIGDTRAVAQGIPLAVLEHPADRTAAPTAPRAREVLGLVRRVLRLQGSGLVRVGPGGRALEVDLPAGVGLGDLDLDRLAAGEVVAGTHGDLVWAAAATPRAGRLGTLTVVVLTREAETGIGAAGAWFLLAAAVTLLVAWAVAARVGGRLTRRLQQTEAVTRRVAAGDLSARVPLPAGGDAGDELASLARSVNALAAALERARGLERQFLLSVSHDLRTPLTSIRGFAEAIAEGAAPDHAQAAAVITAEARRLERLVRDLLELAKLDARRFSLDLRPVDVGEVVRETAEGFRPAADEAGVQLAVEAPGPGDGSAGGGGALRAVVDPDRLAQVVANLVENALKFAAGSIRVGLASVDGTVTIRVDDDGPGIPEGERPRVFERLYSGARVAAREVGSSGLGLAIVRELVEAMGGTVRAEAAPQGGARLAVTLRSSSSA